MPKVIGLGGVFIKSKDPKTLVAWYEEKLGINAGGAPYMVFPFTEETGAVTSGYNIVSFFKADSTYYNPSKRDTMLNLRVDDLFGLLEELKKKGVESVGEPQSGEYGKFGWILDPEDNKIELWEPPNV